MQIRKTTILLAMLTIALVTSIGFVFAASTVDTYESDYTTLKDSYLQKETVYVKWDCSGVTGVTCMLWRGTNFMTSWSGGSTGTYAWATTESTIADTYRVDVYEQGGPKLAECYFDVVEPPLVVPEYALGVLSAVVACFAALGTIGIVGSKRSKKA
ncbi:MAG: hypothetical protein NWF00_02720 [Candidatus Bathyarchaeota archaeon]|nr:hypothetical protein [Candidatus Bathyarchaeota archaeon]